MAGVVARAKSVRWVFNCGDWSPSELDWARLASGIQREEKERIAKFVFRKDAKSAMAGRLLMRKFVADHSGLNWGEVEITRDANNKPRFGDERLQFNVSHQGQFAILAGETGVLARETGVLAGETGVLAGGTGMAGRTGVLAGETDVLAGRTGDKLAPKIGVDVMRVEYTGGKSTSEFFRIMDRQLAEKEWSVIKSQPTERKQWEFFYRFWCLKESYVKAIGVGITVSLKDIVFKLDEKVPNTEKFIMGTKLFVKGVEQSDWVFEEILIDDDHCAAVAVNVSKENYLNLSSVDRFQFLSIGELTDKFESISDPDIDYGRSFSAKPDKP